ERVVHLDRLDLEAQVVGRTRGVTLPADEVARAEGLAGVVRVRSEGDPHVDSARGRGDGLGGALAGDLLQLAVAELGVRRRLRRRLDVEGEGLARQRLVLLRRVVRAGRVVGAVQRLAADRLQLVRALLVGG